MVSICCLAYNHEKYIKDAIDSFLKQKTDFKFEVLIHDDASTDSTAAIIKEIREKVSQYHKADLSKRKSIFQRNKYFANIPISKS